MSSYFYKELPDRPLSIGGRAYKFDWLKVDDEAFAAQLRAAFRSRIGGVVEVTAEQYEEGLKKKQSSTCLNQREEVSAKVLPQPKRSDRKRSVAVGVNAPKPVTASIPAVPLSPNGLPDFASYKPPVGKVANL